MTAAYPRPINSRSDIPNAIAWLEQVGAGFRTPPLQALYRGDIAFLDVGATTPTTKVKAWIGLVRKPALAIVGDDDGYGCPPAGPDGIPGARKLLGWARFIAIHGAGGERHDYEEAVRSTLIMRRVVVVECASDQVETWHAVMRRWAPGTPGVRLIPRDGLPHPIRETVQ